MKCYIISGQPSEVDKVIKENRIRVERGLITITPFHLAGSECAPIADSKDVAAADTKETKKKAKKQ